MEKKNEDVNVTVEVDNESEISPKEEIVDGESKPKLLRLPVLPLNDIVIFPYTLSTLVIDNEETIKFIVRIADGERLVTLFPDLANFKLDPAKDIEDFLEHTENPEFTFDTIDVGKKKLSQVGVLGRIVKLLKFPDNTVRVLVRGLKRVKLTEVLTEKPNITATVEELEELHDETLECVAMAKNAQHQFQEIITMSPNFPEELKVAILNVDDYSRLSDLIADTLNISFTEKLGILTAPTLNERFQLLTILLNREVEVLHLGNDIQSQVSNALSQSQREFFLREQLKTIKQELGDEDANPDITAIRKRMKEKKLPENVIKVIGKELERIEIMPQAASEYHVAYNYVDWLLSIPWDEYTEDRNDIKRHVKYWIRIIMI